MTIGTGFVGRSSIGENLQPGNLMNWTRIAYNSDAGVAMPTFAGLSPWRSPAGDVPEYPRPSNEHSAAPPPQRNGSALAGRPADPSLDALRAELRALVVEELSQLIKR
jgi:acetaldehyde dehydrogenase/alcohol dehydrogenase